MAMRLSPVSSSQSLRSKYFRGNLGLRNIVFCQYRPSICLSRNTALSTVSKIASHAYSSRSSIGSSTAHPGSSLLHDSMSSFLQHASNTSLPTSSTVYVGTHYEYTVLLALARLGFSLTRIGGRSDNGIDLIGTWQLPLPHISTPIRVVLSCKAGSSKTAGSPAWVRELDGAFGGAPVGWRSPETMGFVVTTGAATKGIRDAVRRSTRSVGFISISSEGTIEQFLWNGGIESAVGDGLGVGVRYLEKGGRECVLMWRGQEVEDWQTEVKES